jgi:MFS family permease
MIKGKMRALGNRLGLKPFKCGSPPVYFICLASVAFLLSSPQNMMSPSLTTIALDLGFDERSRDLYIGSYMQLCYAVISLPFSLIGGFFSDHMNRVVLLSIVVSLGGLSMIGFGLFRSYEILLFLRMVQGIAYGSIVPIIYSLMSDLFVPSKRARMSAYLTVFLGGGTLFGQLFAGYTAPILGWRGPFIIFGAITLFQGLMLLQCVKEPSRGSLDLPDDVVEEGEGENVQLLAPAPPSEPNSSTNHSLRLPNLRYDLNTSSTLHMLLVPSISLLLLQALPNRYCTPTHSLRP